MKSKDLLFNEIIFFQFFFIKLYEKKLSRKLILDQLNKDFKKFKFYFRSCDIPFFNYSKGVIDLFNDYENNIGELKGHPILRLDFIKIFNQIKDLIDKSIIDIADLQNQVFEGNKSMDKHFSRERNKKIIKLKKAHFLLEHDSLFCEACNFRFDKSYGVRGQDFIEVHHIEPLSSLPEEGDYISLNELALVCSNCHSIIHAKQPWLSLEELKKLIKDNAA